MSELVELRARIASLEELRNVYWCSDCFDHHPGSPTRVPLLPLSRHAETSDCLTCDLLSAYHHEPTRCSVHDDGPWLGPLFCASQPER